MANEKLYEALGDINEKHINEARAYQCMSIGSMMALRRDGGYSTRRDAKRIMIIGGLITTIFLVMTVLVVLSSLPECVSDVPILTAIEQIDSPALLTMYRVCMFLALVSTNGPGLYARVAVLRGIADLDFVIIGRETFPVVPQFRCGIWQYPYKRAVVCSYAALEPLHGRRYDLVEIPAAPDQELHIFFL